MSQSFEFNPTPPPPKGPPKSEPDFLSTPMERDYLQSDQRSTEKQEPSISPEEYPTRPEELKLEKPQPSKWEVIKSVIKATPEIAKTLWHDRHSRNQMAETVYTTLTSIGGVKFVGDLIRIPLGLKYGEQAGGDIYRKGIDIQERRHTAEAGLEFTEALIQSEAQRKLNNELKTELLNKKKEELKNKGVDYDQLNEEEQTDIINKVKQEARQEVKKRLGSDTDLEIVRQKAQEMQLRREALALSSAPEEVRTRARDIRLALQNNQHLTKENKELLRFELKNIKERYGHNGRLTQENSSLMQSQINQVYLEYKENRACQAKERQKEIKEAVDTFVQDKTSSMRIARDAWNSFITLTGVGAVLPPLRAGGYFGFELTERIHKSSRTVKQKEVAQQVHQRRRLSDEKEDINDDHEKAKSNYLKNLAIETAREYGRDLRALTLKGRTEQSGQAKGPTGTVRRIAEAGQSLGSLARAFSLFSQGLMIERTGEWDKIPEIINHKLEEISATHGGSIIQNFTKNIDQTIQGYKRTFNPQTYEKVINHLQSLGVDEGSSFSLGTATAAAAEIAKPPSPLPETAPEIKLQDHQVERGESLWAIAKPVAQESGMSINSVIEAIKKENHLTDDLLQPNQILQVPTAQSLIEQATTITAEKIRSLDDLVRQGIGTPYSPQNNCMTFLQNCFRKAGLTFNADDFSYAGNMVKNIGQPVEGATVANIDQLKNHPGQYLIAFGHRYKDSSQGPSLETWNHAGYVNVDEAGNITLTHASSNAIKTTDNEFYNFNECKKSQGAYFTPSGERLNVEQHPGRDGQPENGWVATESLDDYLSDIRWTKVALTRLDGQAITLETERQSLVPEEAFSSRQKAIIEKLQNESISVLDQKKAAKRSSIYRCSADVIQRLRLISRSLPEELHLALKNGAIVDAPEVEQAILSSGGEVAAELKDTVQPTYDNAGKRLEFLEKYGQESAFYKTRAQEWLRQARYGQLGLATFLHEGTSIEQMIIRGLPSGGGVNSHVVMLLGETAETMRAKPGQTIGEIIQQRYQINDQDLDKCSWVFEALGIKVNDEDITKSANWTDKRLTGQDLVLIHDIAMNDNVGGKVRHGGLIRNFFIKDHTFHPISVLRPNAAITEKALGSYELPLKVKDVYQVQEGESAADIFKKFKIDPKEQGDMLSYIYAQGVDAKNLRAGAVIAIPENGELKNYHQQIIEMAEERLDKQSWVRKDEAQRNIVVAAGETPQTMMERVMGGKRLSRSEANRLLAHFQQKESELDDKHKTFPTDEQNHLQLKAGDVLKVPYREVETLEQQIDQQRQKDRTFTPDQITVYIKGKEKTIQFSDEDKTVIDNVLQKHPHFNGQMSEYLTAILVQEQKRASGIKRRGLAESLIYKIPLMEKIAPKILSVAQHLPFVGDRIPSNISSVGTFQVQANELILKKLQELGETDIDNLPDLKSALAHNQELNSVAAAIMAQDHVDNLQNALRAFGQKNQPGQEAFDLAIINSHNRGLNKTLMGTLELRVKDLSIALGRGDLWQQYFSNQSITGNNRERSPLANVLTNLAQDLQQKGFINLSESQIRHDASQAKTNLTNFLSSPTMQALRGIYPRLMKGQEMSLLASRSDMGRPDFKAWNYASLIADSDVLKQMPRAKRL